MKTNSFLRLVVLVGSISVSASSALGNRILVRQDGSGDYTTIGAAVAAAAAGDTIDVGPGTYAEQVDVYVKLTFLSTHGTDQTIMDGGVTHYLLWFRGGTGHYVEGITFRNGWNFSGGGAIRCQAGATLTLRNNVFESNSSDFDGGALFTRDGGSWIDAFDCVFRGNRAAPNGGAAEVVLGSRMTFTGCSFFGNSCDLHSGTIGCDHSSLDVSNCLFVDNTSPSGAAAVYYYVATGSVGGNTFYSNAGAYHGTVVVQDSPNTTVFRNIFARDEEGVGLLYIYETGTHYCNLFWDNTTGAVSGDALAPDEIEADPLFCGAESGDFTISVDSPAAPAHSPCGQLIGAFPPVCDEPVPVTPATWGQIKALYRR